MKRVCSAVLCLVLMMTGLCALAESTYIDIGTDFLIQVTLPAGYTYEVADMGDGVPLRQVRFLPGSEDGLYMFLYVSYDDSFAGRSYEDLSAEEADLLFGPGAVDMSDPELSYAETSHGSKLVILNENSEKDEYVDISTLYQGYFVELMLVRNDTTVQISGEEIQLAVDMLSEMWFVAGR
ncbi:MAG: hypothetical protein CW338_00280 [Clostridiales bacterium]|nr:hypothetical protein [Clostridiales bacterium]